MSLRSIFKLQSFLIKNLASLGRYFILVIKVFFLILRFPLKWRLVREQLYGIGVLSFPVVAITGFSTGTVLAAQSFYQLADKGLAGVTGLMVVKAMFTEMGPVLTAFMITGRVGSAMCAELGSMKVTEQLDALRSMAVNPLCYLVAPRFVSGVFMLPLLTIFSNFMGIIGAYLVSIFFFGMSSNSFLDPVTQYITYFDFYSGLFKAFIFGILIITISCYKGINAEGGATGVGNATTSAVVVCYSCILIVNFFLTIALNLLNVSIHRWI